MEAEAAHTRVGHRSGAECRCTTSPSQEIEMAQRRELPRHELTVFRPRRTRYATLIPVWNEGERLRAQLRALAARDDVADVFIADARSTDGSTAPKELAALGVRAQVTVSERGVSLALRPALAHALRDGYDGIILMDGNGKDDPAMLEAFADALARGADYAQGSRYIPGAVA